MVRATVYVHLVAQSRAVEATMRELASVEIYFVLCAIVQQHDETLSARSRSVTTICN